MKEAKEVQVKGWRISPAAPSICVALVGENVHELLTETKKIRQLNPDIVEWRVDCFKKAENIVDVMDALRAINEVIYDYPLIFTCRDGGEGGNTQIDWDHKVSIICEVIPSGLVDIVDIELMAGMDRISKVVLEARKHDVYVTISMHDFNGTPSKEEIIEILIEQQEAGADIAKVAVMPNDIQDVLNLLDATATFTKLHATIPVVTVAMSQLGVISRLAGFLFGSAITFASASNGGSAPGQVSVAQTRATMETLRLSINSPSLTMESEQQSRRKSANREAV